MNTTPQKLMFWKLGSRKLVLAEIASTQEELKSLFPGVPETPEKPEMITWEKTFGGSEDDSANDIIQTNDGGYAVAGSTLSKGAGEGDAWLIKLDNKGNRVWERTYGGNKDDTISSLIQTTDGGYVVAGYTKSKGAGGDDFWILNLDSQGNMLWDKTFGGSGDDVAISIIQTNDGGYALVGLTTSKGAGGYDAWLLKLDNQGNKLWDKTFGGDSDDYVLSLIQNDDYNYILSGYTVSFGAGGGDAWVIKMDDKGNIVWDKNLYKEDAWVIKMDDKGNIVWDKRGIDFEAITSLIQIPDGNYFAVGFIISKGKTYNMYTKEGTEELWKIDKCNIWLTKLDNQGNIIWDKILSGSENELAYSLIQTIDGGYAIAGFTESTDTEDKNLLIKKLNERGVMGEPLEEELESTEVSAKTEIVWTTFIQERHVVDSIIQTMDGGYAMIGSVFDWDPEGIWVVKLDKKGGKIWEKTFAGRFHDRGEGIIQTSDGGYIIVGEKDSSSGNPGNIWLMKLDDRGNKIWDRVYKDLSNDLYSPESMIHTNDDCYLIVGDTYSWRTEDYNIFAIKIDSQGKIMWERTFGGNDDDFADPLIQTTDGGYIIGGHTYSKGAGNADAWLIKLDNIGNIIWNHTYGGSNHDEAISIIQAADGGYMVAGNTESKGFGGSDIWFFKLDEQGNIVWDTTYGGRGGEEVHSLIQTTDDCFVMAGEITSKSVGSWDIWLIKIDNTGNIVWDQTFGGSKRDIPSSVIQTTDGGYVVAGETNSIDYRNVLIIKLDKEKEN